MHACIPHRGYMILTYLPILKNSTLVQDPNLISSTTCCSNTNSPYKLRPGFSLLLFAGQSVTTAVEPGKSWMWFCGPDLWPSVHKRGLITRWSTPLVNTRCTQFSPSRVSTHWPVIQLL